jgi:hypothetical protein
VLIYLRSPEFKYSEVYSDLDLPDSLIARNNIIAVHCWLLDSSLRNIRKSVILKMNETSWLSKIFDKETRGKEKDYKRVMKLVYLTSHNLRDEFLHMTENTFKALKISPPQRRKLEKIAENHAQQIQVLLRMHFEDGNKGREGLEVVMQEIFFPQYKDAAAYQPFVHQMAEYTYKHWEYLRTVSFDDFLYGTIDWDVLRMDREYLRSTIEKLSIRNEEDDADIEEADAMFTQAEAEDEATSAEERPKQRET